MSQSAKSRHQARRLIEGYLFENEKNNSPTRVNQYLEDIYMHVPILRTENGGKFTLGAVRMCIEIAHNTTQLNVLYNVLQSGINHIIEDGHENEYTKDFNGMSAYQFINTFSDERSDGIIINDDDEINEEESEYEIIRIEDFEHAKEYSPYTSWCITKNKSTFDSYKKDKNLYFCVKRGFKEMQSSDIPFAKDEYGLSLIAVFIDQFGNISSCTGRWNHSYGGNDRLLSEYELTHIVKRKFKETFCQGCMSYSDIEKAIENIGTTDISDKAIEDISPYIKIDTFHYPNIDKTKFILIRFGEKFNVIDIIENGKLLFPNCWFKLNGRHDGTHYRLVSNERGYNYLNEQTCELVYKDKWLNHATTFYENDDKTNRYATIIQEGATKIITSDFQVIWENPDGVCEISYVCNNPKYLAIATNRDGIQKAIYTNHTKGDVKVNKTYKYQEINERGYNWCDKTLYHIKNKKDDEFITLSELSIKEKGILWDSKKTIGRIVNKDLQPCDEYPYSFISVFGGCFDKSHVICGIDNAYDFHTFYYKDGEIKDCVANDYIEAYGNYLYCIRRNVQNGNPKQLQRIIDSKNNRKYRVVIGDEVDKKQRQEWGKIIDDAFNDSELPKTFYEETVSILSQVYTCMNIHPDVEFVSQNINEVYTIIPVIQEILNVYEKNVLTQFWVNLIDNKRTTDVFIQACYYTIINKIYKSQNESQINAECQISHTSCVNTLSQIIQIQPNTDEEEIIRRWGEIGLCDGLSTATRKSVALMYQKMADHLINEHQSDQEDGSFETVVFPIIRRVMARDDRTESICHLFTFDRLLYWINFYWKAGIGVGQTLSLCYPSLIADIEAEVTVIVSDIIHKKLMNEFDTQIK